MAIVLRSLKRLLAFRISNSPHRHRVQRTQVNPLARRPQLPTMEYISHSEDLYTSPNDPYWPPCEGSTEIEPQ